SPLRHPSDMNGRMHSRVMRGRAQRHALTSCTSGVPPSMSALFNARMPRLISPYKADAVSSCNCRLSFVTSFFLLSVFVGTFEGRERCSPVGDAVRLPTLCDRTGSTSLLAVRSLRDLLRRTA